MRGFILRVMIGCLVLSLGAIGLFSQPFPEFSLDDYPAAPNNGPVVPWFGSAENEWGQANAAWWAGFVGPSPSLGPVTGFFDSDVLVAGPALLITFPPPPYYMDAVSTNNWEMSNCDTIFVEFSVDRPTGGATPADASWNQAFLNEQPGDIYRVDNPGFAHLRLFVPLPAPGPGWTAYYGGPVNPANGFTSPPYQLPGPAGQGGNNWLLYDHFNPLGLIPLGPAPYPGITPGSHDNIDAYNRWLYSLVNSPNTEIYFCLHPASVVNLGPTVPPPPGPLSAADIYFCVQPGGTFWPPSGRYAWAGQMGLDTFGTNTDSIDGLAVFDVNQKGVCEPGVDYAGFSLAPGSATLTALVNAGYAVNAASIFMTDFQGFFYLYLFDTDIGVGNGPNVTTPPPQGPGPLPVIPYVDINVDALELTIDPPPLPYINPITRPVIDPIIRK
jgi:hypothetical protein